MLIFTVLLLFAGRQEVHAQQFALGTDAVMIGALTPNVVAEVVTGEKTSLAVAVAGNYHPWKLDFKGIGVRPEFKIWLSGRPMIREYLGIAAFVDGYEYTFDDLTRKGMSGGIGITGGYMFRLSERFCLELSAGAGLMYYSHELFSKQEEYGKFFPGDEPVSNNASGFRLVPVKLGVTFIYILK